MSNTVEFILKMKDLMSSGMQKVASTAQSSFSTVNRIVNGTQGNFNRLGSNVSDLNKRLDDLRRTREISVDSRQIRTVNREIDRIENRIHRIENLGGRRRGGASSNGLLGTVGGMRTLVATAGIAAATTGTIQSVRSATKDQSINTAIDFSTMDKGAESINFVKKTVDDLGLSYEASAQGAKTLFGSMRGGQYTLQSQQKIFKGIAEAGAAMSISAENQVGALLALSQMASKGTVSAEELRGQLGERIPGAFGIAAKAMGVTEMKLNDLLQKGLIPSAAFLPKFADELHNTFGVQAIKNSDSAIANFNRLQNTIYNTKVAFGTALLPVAVSVSKALVGLSGVTQTLIQTVQPFFDWLASLNLGAYFSDFAASAKKIGAVVLPIFMQLKPVISTAVIVIIELAKIVRDFLTNLIVNASPALLDIARIINNVLTPALRVTGWLLEKILNIAGWVIDKLLLLIKPIVKLFAVISEGVGWMLDKVADTVDNKMPTIAERIKAGINRDEVSAFFKQVGNLHGAKYSQGLIENLKKVAIGMDNLYHTNAYTNKFAELFGGPELAAVSVVAKSRAPRASLGAGSFSEVSDKSDKINSGGVRNINITIGKFFEDFIIKTETINEGVGELERKVEECLYRILNSGNAIQDN